MSGFYIGVDGKARKVKGAYIGVDGKARKVKKGYIGDENGVARLCYSLGKNLNEYPVGSSVYLNESGSPTEYLIVHQGLPDNTRYDASCDGVWLLRKDIHSNRKWDSTNNDYANSDIHRYLNGTFLGLFDVDVQNAIKQVKIPYRPSSGHSTTCNILENGLSTKIFLLSMLEVNHNVADMPLKEGNVLGYFSDCAVGAADNKRVAKLKGAAEDWSVRSPYCWSGYGDGRIFYIMSNGNYTNQDCMSTCGIRPALILPSDTKFNAKTNAIL